ncbi:WD40-repeat-containing domain protein [Suillus bovinus]|uniref:WD40-repeat-containing domain protein n=1 Tax=Suillus bovinus TaxID=48563 RepID=UPI001B886D27|nr:WD40-repeat-containing domain protein [Suillus bovinus]KAG2158573.1 WD40-repeat-containing domain protein [Suillus bovinus]
MSQLIPSTTPLRAYKDHTDAIRAVVVFPDGRRMVTGSSDKTLCLWDLRTGAMVKKMEGHCDTVTTLAVSRDGQLIASGDQKGAFIVWHGETGQCLTQSTTAHSNRIYALDFSSDGTVLASGSEDNTTKLWCTTTWQLRGNPIQCGNCIRCVQYSPSGELLAIATHIDIQIYKSNTKERIAHFKGQISSNLSLVWTPDGSRLLTGGDAKDSTIREWDTVTWKQVGDPWMGHISGISSITVHSSGTLVASASYGGRVRLWRLSERRVIAIFQHSGWVRCVTFSVDGKHIFSGGFDRMISAWAVPKDSWPESKAQASANRRMANLEKSLWEDVLLDAQKVIDLNPLSHVGYRLKHTALHGAQRYDEAIEAFTIMLAKLNNAHDIQIRKLREQYASPSQADGVIQKVMKTQLDTVPHRLLNTTTGFLCDRDMQISAFKTATDYKQLLLSIMNHADIPREIIADAVAKYFACVMLSHRWEGKEPLLQDIKDKAMYQLEPAGGLRKLQLFCKKAREAGFRWAWVDSCCIDQKNNVELQKSLNSMFAWYHYAALTMVYLCDVPPSSKSGALAKSAWNSRGWTVPELLAPRVILFYQQDWTPYLDNDSHNHKESVEIMHELEDATGVDARVLVAFQPGMRDAREKLRWASTRETAVAEDIAYSLFGIFGIQLPILYDENKENALGRLLQEIVARSGDITALDWVGQASTFNSCLPANISSYAAPPCTLPSLSEDQIQTAISSLRHTVAVELAAARFANCRLHLPCIVHRVTEVRRRQDLSQETNFTYVVKADGLRDLLVTTEEVLIQFSRTRPTRQTFFLIRPWDRRLLELPEFAEEPAFDNDAGDLSDLESPLDHSRFSTRQERIDSERHSQALRLTVRLGQPFSALLLAQQRGGEYKRIASDRDIIAQVKDVGDVHNMDIRTLEIL